MREDKIFYQNKVKRIFYSIEFTNGFRRAAFGALILIYFLSLGHNLVNVTALFAISSIILILFEFPTGAIADHYSRRLSVIISFFLMGVSFLGIYLFKDFFLLGFFYILGDIAWTFQSGTSNAWAVDNLKYGKHKKNLAVLFSRFFFFEKIGNILGALVGIILVSINFRFIWLAISLSNFIFTYVLIKYMEDKNFNPKKSKYNFLKETLLKMKESIIYFFKKKNKTTRGLALSLIFGVISVNSFYIIIPLVLKDKIGLLPYQISGIFFIIGVIVLIAPILGERFSRKLGYRKTLTFGTLLYAISMLFFGLFYYFIFSLLTLILVRFFLDGTDAIHESAVQHSIPSNCRATLGSAMSVMWGLSNAIAVYSSGLVISSYGLKFATLISFIFALITSLIYFKILKEKDEFKLS